MTVEPIANLLQPGLERLDVAGVRARQRPDDARAACRLDEAGSRHEEHWRADRGQQHAVAKALRQRPRVRSAEHTSELQSLRRSSYALFCWKKNKQQDTNE